MSAEEKDQTEEQGKSGKKGVLMMGVIALIALAAGVATPFAVAKFSGPSDAAGSSSQMTLTSGIKIPDANNKMAFIEFDETVVNLDESRFNRYLKVSFSLQVAENQKFHIEKLLAEKKMVLKNWLISHLADKSLEDIRGKMGYNRLRREIHNQFNATLFDDGLERIQDVLFKDFNVQ